MPLMALSKIYKNRIHISGIDPKTSGRISVYQAERLSFNYKRWYYSEIENSLYVKNPLLKPDENIKSIGQYSKNSSMEYGMEQKRTDRLSLYGDEASYNYFSYDERPDSIKRRIGETIVKRKWMMKYE